MEVLAAAEPVLPSLTLFQGPDLTELKLFASEMPSEDRGLVLSNSERIRTVHNSFARPGQAAAVMVPLGAVQSSFLSWTTARTVG
jgi:hypothetical protein